MRTLTDIAAYLRSRLTDARLTQAQLGAASGVSRRTLTHVLGGRIDYKLTTLLAILDRLGLELAIVPKPAATGVERDLEPTEPAVKSRVQAALEHTRSHRDAS
ncbi:helix-turn-helix domain-containing protein [Pararobbsia silviterrae]|uniref:Helix-turn-helix domain-containing protein n=1 Tax=Pararobbsia silviterrae TaxID=1792498 RepID=A0A494XZ69_9BURK|nr:helix-turn-helix domain-containing protein [Pararobbsia silviterrae]RKP55812.1 helix-turn-helix domain-containing protein [Pararobbsia silviterrae]